MKKPEQFLTIAVLLLAAILLAVSVLLYMYAQGLSETVREQEQEIARLEAIRVALLETSTPKEPVGGPEVEVPAPKPAVDGWSFPIAEEDYLMLTSPTGVRVSPILNVEMYHRGVDIAATWRAQIVAAADGVVVKHYPVPGTIVPGSETAVYRGHDVYGGMIEIEHEDGWRTVYAHLSHSNVRQGMRVQQGQIIGRVGNTGMSRGEHLHFELIAPDGSHVNPLVYISPEPIEEKDHGDEEEVPVDSRGPDFPDLLEYTM